MSWYTRILENALLPAHNLVRRRNYVRYRRFLEESQWWSRERLQEFQWQELQALLRHIFSSVLYYQKKYAEAGIRLEDIRTPQDFARLPVLTRREVNDHREQLRSTAYRGKLLPHATGGSSGMPTRFYITIESYDWRTAATQRVYAWTGCRLGERALYLWGAPVGRLGALPRAKKKAFEFFQGQLVVNTFAQDEELWRRVYRRAVKFKPRLVVGFVSSLEEFSRFLRHNRLRLTGIRAVITAAEPVYESTRANISEALDAPVFNTYGSREFMSIGGECERHTGLHLNLENLLVETACPPAAGPSEILVTDLHNYGMPFVRYATGDLGLLDGSDCPCGRVLPLLKSVEGRMLDSLRTTDGRRVPGEFFPHLMKELPEIREFQVEQKALDLITVRAILSSDLSPKSRLLLKEETAKVFGERTVVKLVPVQEIERLPSGKRRVTIGLREARN